MNRISSLAHDPQGFERNSAIPTANFSMNEIRKLPDAELLALATQVDAEAARAVDEQFAARVSEGAFDDLAAEALQELREHKTVPLHEVLDQRGVS